MQIAAQTVARFHYTLTNSKGEVLDQSPEGQPMAYLHGGGNIIPGLEKELAGKVAGDKLSVTVAPGEGYGEKRMELIQQVPRDAFQGIDTIEVGMAFQAQSAQGPMRVTVTAVEADTITVDGNHPLAGETLKFEVEIADVRAATEEETTHGHAHGDGGHHHH
ncbi:FKBP-type peptidyl-prolyl cis-trans isomerase [Polycyclovorans algicola]|uniref:FKBP-type peptidyl-prolyl cis-trans isomerase n=1 Tax=Polycyclovorans algicola TaxID=616992 RepID=UPI0004A72685|nr:peptidylprolyl isomerase [Polycyclovorans algicola]